MPLLKLEDILGYKLSIQDKSNKCGYIYYDDEIVGIIDKVKDYEIVDEYYVYWEEYGDAIMNVYLDKDEAIKSADMQWNHLTEHDKKKRTVVFVGLCKGFDCNAGEANDIIKQYK